MSKGKGHWLFQLEPAQHHNMLHHQHDRQFNPVARFYDPDINVENVNNQATEEYTKGRRHPLFARMSRPRMKQMATSKPTQMEFEGEEPSTN